MNHANLWTSVVGVNERGASSATGTTGLADAGRGQPATRPARGRDQPAGVSAAGEDVRHPVGTVQRICTYERWQTAVEYRRVVGTAPTAQQPSPQHIRNRERWSFALQTCRGIWEIRWLTTKTPAMG